MSEGSRFLVVEYAGHGLALADWTRDHPGTTVDLIGEPARGARPERVHPTVFLVKGAPRAALVQLMERLDRVHGPIETLRMEAARGQWLGRMQVRASEMHSMAAAALMQFQHRFGSPWTHVEDGVVYMRAQLRAGEDGDRLVHQVRGYLAKHDVEAHVSVQEFSTHDHGVWDDLVQHAIGLAP